MLAAAECDRSLHLSSTFNKLPSLLSILKKSVKPEAKEILQTVTKVEVKVKEEPIETECVPDTLCEQHSFLFLKDSSEV